MAEDILHQHKAPIMFRFCSNFQSSQQKDAYTHPIDTIKLAGTIYCSSCMDAFDILQQKFLN